MSEKQYSAASLQVLSGLEPVRRRPGMYTDTSRPNHLVQEVVDNSVDEAISGYAKLIEVTICKDGSVEVIDDGRGMPVDDHPEYKISGVELILTRLHSGCKFDSEKNKCVLDKDETKHNRGTMCATSVYTELDDVNNKTEITHKVKKMRYKSGKAIIILQRYGSDTITPVNDNKVSSAAGIAFEPIEYKINPKQTNVPCKENKAPL